MSVIWYKLFYFTTLRSMDIVTVNRELFDNFGFIVSPVKSIKTSCCSLRLILLNKELMLSLSLVTVVHSTDCFLFHKRINLFFDTSMPTNLVYKVFGILHILINLVLASCFKLFTCCKL